MCGIGGIVKLDNSVATLAGLQRMGAIMASRGPDHEGWHVSKHIGLIHRRLSILDLSERGHCPMPNENGLIQALLNGEIYNWRELRAELLQCGHVFRSETDSEVIVHGYEEWGEALFAKLRGMFAIAIWDQVHSRLFLARDRLGEKPLFLLRDDHKILFASSINALLAYDEQSLPINPDALVCYLSHSFIPAAHTIWQGVQVFPPAHYAIIEQTDTFVVKKYWSFPDRPPQPLSLHSAERNIEQVLDDSVKRCLDADAPVGVFLSGGVDSSLVAALAARHHPHLHSFSVGFQEAAWDELRYARKVAEHLNLEYHEMVIQVQDVLKTLPELVWHYGQPFGDASAVPTYLVSKLARQTVKVCLSGDGGDESFAGYWRVQSCVYAAHYGRLLPRSVRTQIIPVLSELLGSTGKRLAAMNTLSLQTPAAAYTNSQSWHAYMGEIAGSMLEPGLLHDRIACRVGSALDRQKTTTLQRLLLDDFQVQLPDAYLTKVDVASMAASLEVRAPLLDVSVLESAWLLPDRMKLHWGERKWLLKRIAARLTPSEVIYRPKMGFGIPLTEWFKSDLGEVLEALLQNSVAAELRWIDSPRVLKALEEHRQGKADHQNRLWLILWLELWFRVVVTQEMSRDADLTSMFNP